MNSYSRRKVLKSEKHHSKKNLKKNKQFKNLTNMVKKKLNNLAGKRFLKNVKVVFNEDHYFWSIVNGDDICLFKILLMGESYSVWDRLYGDKWFITKGMGGPDLDEAINYFESRRM